MLRHAHSPDTVRLAPRAILIALLAGSTWPAWAADPGVVVALDSSRSLSAEESRAAAGLARDLAARLSASGSPGVLSFDDAVHWFARPGESGPGSALEALSPTGRYTVMNDGLVEAVRALPDGGVVVLISDGKDENSATTTDDVARLASERGVRLVTVGAGRVEERTMRRLALLTGGAYAGPASTADAEALGAEVEGLRRQVAEAVAAKALPPAPAPPPQATEAAAPTSPAPAPVEAVSRDGSRRLLLLGALVAAAGIVIGFLLARRRSSAAPDHSDEIDPGTRPGVHVAETPAAASPAPLPISPSPEPLDEKTSARLRILPAVGPNGLMEISLDDTAAFQRLPFSESIERTLVLLEELVLITHAPGQEPRSFRIPPGRAVDIGRDVKKNSLAFPDATLSLQHLRLVLEEGEVYLLDLGSTNGVFVRERRVSSALLHPGDKFRAGMFDFELTLHRASMS